MGEDGNLTLSGSGSGHGEESGELGNSNYSTGTRFGWGDATGSPDDGDTDNSQDTFNYIGDWSEDYTNAGVENPASVGVNETGGTDYCAVPLGGIQDGRESATTEQTPPAVVMAWASPMVNPGKKRLTSRRGHGPISQTAWNDTKARSRF